jgi:hypothetical protein
MKMLIGGGDGVQRVCSATWQASCCCGCRWSCCTASDSTRVESMQWMEGALVLAFCVLHASSAAAMKLTVRQSMG